MVVFCFTRKNNAAVRYSHPKSRWTLSFVHTWYMFGLHSPSHTSSLSDSGAMTKGQNVASVEESTCLCLLFYDSEDSLPVSKVWTKQGVKVYFVLRCVSSCVHLRPLLCSLPSPSTPASHFCRPAATEPFPRISIIDAGMASDEARARLPAVSIVCLIHSISARLFLHSR